MDDPRERWPSRLNIRGDEARTRVHCSCPMVVDVGDGKAHLISASACIDREPKRHVLVRPVFLVESTDVVFGRPPHVLAAHHHP